MRRFVWIAAIVGLWNGSLSAQDFRPLSPAQQQRISDAIGSGFNFDNLDGMTNDVEVGTFDESDSNADGLGGTNESGNPAVGFSDEFLENATDLEIALVLDHELGHVKDALLGIDVEDSCYESGYIINDLVKVCDLIKWFVQECPPGVDVYCEDMIEDLCRFYWGSRHELGAVSLDCEFEGGSPPPDPEICLDCIGVGR